MKILLSVLTILGFAGSTVAAENTHSYFCTHVRGYVGGKGYVNAENAYLLEIGTAYVKAAKLEKEGTLSVQIAKKIFNNTAITYPIANIELDAADSTVIRLAGHSSFSLMSVVIASSDDVLSRIFIGNGSDSYSDDHVHCLENWERIMSEPTELRF